MIHYTYMTSPLGKLLLQMTNTKLSGLWICDQKHMPKIQPTWVKDDEIFHEIKIQLEKYFAGKLKKFSIPIYSNGTDFQKSVWKELTKIPFGKKITYKDVATKINHPKAMRAVGSANGKNPICIIVPCHRVIGADGKLSGYAGGIAAKEWLLDHEAKYI
jgi:methylated-DNA-[protein]-cysteine S-methyltransferase